MRRLTDQEGQRLQQIVRRGSTSSVRYRRAMMLLASAGGNRTSGWAAMRARELLPAPDTVRRRSPRARTAARAAPVAEAS
ncbi:hypothetical protein [Streptomyces mirabilis]|uniref:hypothetical protein n=1 Tax=Streptomyces mirabilis TaxID=68239 RepID=UPI0033F79D8D